METFYKEDMPNKTIKKMKKQLERLGINLKETWQDTSLIGTYSVRLTYNDTEIGTNGKGTSKEYALASAYGEFFERLQNKFLNTEYPRHSTTHYFFLDEKLCDTEFLIKQNDVVTNMILELNTDTYLCNVDNETKKILYDRVMGYYKDKDNNYTTVPYLNITKNKTEYVPLFFTRSIYGSNGMCAGNTKYEALVQGLSEIFERNAIREVLSNTRIYPDVDGKIVEKFDRKFKFLSRIMSDPKYDIMLKDCSEYASCSVVACIVLEKNTGKLGVNFGAHPDIYVAISRAFTEACQGQDVRDFVSNSKVDFTNKYVRKVSNFYNIHSLSRGKYPYEFLCDSKQNNNKKRIATSKNNKDQFYAMVEELKENNYEVLIRDVSITGIPSYSIIVPGFSELVDLSLEQIRMLNTRSYVRKLLKKPSIIECSDIEYIKAVLKHYINYLAFRSLDSLYKRNDGKEYPLKDQGLDTLFLLALVYIMDEKFSEAMYYTTIIIKRLNSKYDKDILEKISSIHYYCQLKSVDDKADVKDYLGKFFNDNNIEFLEYVFLKEVNPIYAIIGDDTDKSDKKYEDITNMYEIYYDIERELIESNLTTYYEQFSK